MDRIFEDIRSSKTQEIVVLGGPASLRPALSRLPVLTIHHHFQSVRKARFWLAFVKQESELLALAAEIAARASDDAILWLAYSSKALMHEFGEDVCKETMEKHGFRRSETTASDPQLTALRFERIGSSDIPKGMPGEPVPIPKPDNQNPDNARPESQKPGGKNAANARKTAPRAGRSSQDSARPGPVRNTKARAARPGSGRRGATQSGADNSEAGNNGAGKQ